MFDQGQGVRAAFLLLGRPLMHLITLEQSSNPHPNFALSTCRHVCVIVLLTCLKAGATAGWNCRWLIRGRASVPQLVG